MSAQLARLCGFLLLCAILYKLNRPVLYGTRNGLFLGEVAKQQSIPPAARDADSLPHKPAFNHRRRKAVQQSIPPANVGQAARDDGGDSLQAPRPPAVQEYGKVMNIVDGKMYPHHPVMLQVPVKAYATETDFLVEVNGLRVPAKYDCDIFNGGQHWGNHYYFYETISRWYACWLHHAAIQSGYPLEVTPLPAVDDEYNEQVAVYQSVLRARPGQPYNVAEFGARWGTWGSRAVAFWRQQRPGADYNLYFVEADNNNCDGIRTVGRKNNISFQLDCQRASADAFKTWSDKLDHVDLIDVDIQEAEASVMPALMDVLDSKVYRLIIATHTAPIHAQMRKLLAHWITIWDVPLQHNFECMMKYLRGHYQPKSPNRFKWHRAVAEGCWHSTPRGPVIHCDGELILDNPKFVDRSKTFSVNDTELKIADWLNGPPVGEVAKQQNIPPTARDDDSLPHKPAFGKVPRPPAVQEYGRVMNIVDGKMYPHHPVMLQVPVKAYATETDFLVEVNGLRVPAKYDCDIFNGGQHWGNHYYFYETISRWYACWLHHAAIQSGYPLEVTPLPAVDDEYNEQVAVYQSVLRARPGQPYNVAEFGARWGTWGSRAVAFWRQQRPGADYNLYFVEADNNNCDGIRTVGRKNNISFQLDCQRASADTFNKWSDKLDHVDLIDVDIQEAEASVMPALMHVLESKVYRLIIATHTAPIHAQMRKLFAHWITIWDVPLQHNFECMMKYLRGHYQPKSPNRFKWDRAVAEGCWHSTPRGPVIHCDGELILDNPKFVERSKAFSVYDTDLKIADWL